MAEATAGRIGIYVISTVHRPLAELQAYAQRLHKIDPGCSEPIPVTPEEAFTVQEERLKRIRMTDRNCFDVEELNLLGHRLKIL